MLLLELPAYRRLCSLESMCLLGWIFEASLKADTALPACKCSGVGPSGAAPDLQNAPEVSFREVPSPAAATLIC